MPPGAVLDLFYVRASFQKAYEQADAPITLVLPNRAQAGPRDSITIRAMLDGYQQSQVRVPVRSRTKKVVVELEPLANSLLAITHRHVAGRGTLAFLTKEALTFRIKERDDGFSVVLVGTGKSPEAAGTIEGASSSLIESLREQQIGQDLMVRAVLRGRGCRELGAFAPEARRGARCAHLRHRSGSGRRWRRGRASRQGRAGTDRSG